MSASYRTGAHYRDRPRRRGHRSSRLPSSNVELVAEAALQRSLVEKSGASWQTDCGQSLNFIAAYAGLRLGEIRALRWRDVDFAKRLIHIRRAYTQNTEDTPSPARPAPCR